MTADDLQDLVRRQVAGVQSGLRIPSMAMGLGRNGKPLGVYGQGLAEVGRGGAGVGRGRTVTPATQYRIGSITKTFTAAAVLLLVERGELDLDEPVDSYLPGTSLGRVRLRQLLSHAGGVEREAPLPMWRTMIGPDVDELLESLTRSATVDRPGARWHYSNLGYALLGQVLHRVTGRPGEEIISTELLAPLGLTSTTWQPEPDHAGGYRLDPYRSGVVQPEPAMEQGAIGVAGQLWSTPTDLLTWGFALLGGVPDALSPEIGVAMRSLQVMADPDAWTQGHGLGLMLRRCDGRILSGHTGGVPGYQAALWMDPKSGLVASAFVNVTRGVELTDRCAELIEQAAGRLPADPEPAWTPILASSEPDELDGLLGRWWSEGEETVFCWRDGGLTAFLAGRPSGSQTWFQPVGRHRYLASRGRLCGEWLEVLRGVDGEVLELEWATYRYRRHPS
jgi:CubicO group peptidase (beta-lactamase class C family)